MLSRSNDGLPAGWPADHGIKTLGFNALIWAETYLAQPDGPNAGDPWRWTDTQGRLVAWWYAITETGRWLFNRGQVVKPKGAGKSPFAAALSCCELGAELHFDGFDAHGEPVGKPIPSPYVQLAAVSEDQADNTMSLVIAMLTMGSAYEAESLRGLDTGLTRVRTRRGILRPVTASATSREGQRTTAAILDETHLWVAANSGIRLAETMHRNLAKMSGRAIETTNTWEPGADSVAESTADAAAAITEGRAKDTGIMRYHPTVNVPDLADETTLRAALASLYGDSPWIEQDRIVSSIYDLGTHPADSRRYYLNEVNSRDDSLITARAWDACGSAETLTAGEAVTLGFDGAVREDATALVACRVSDRLFIPLGVWEKPDGPAGRDWEIDRDAVNECVIHALTTYRVVGFYGDVEHWESYLDLWAKESQLTESALVRASTRHPIAWDMRGRLQQSTLANERLTAAINDGLIKHSGDLTLRRHVLNARRRPNRYGISFGKERRGSPRKIDGYAAMLLADMARYDVDATGKLRTSRKVLVFS